MYFGMERMGFSKIIDINTWINRIIDGNFIKERRKMFDYGIKKF